MKKLITYVTLLVFVLQLIAGCKSTSTTTKPTGPYAESQRDTPPQPNQDKTKIYLYTEGAGLQSLVTDALAQPEVQQAKTFLEAKGYTFYLDKCIATKQVSMDNLDAMTKVLPQAETPDPMSLVALAFGIDDPARAAYIAFGKEGDKTMTSVTEIWFSEEQPEPGYEPITEFEKLWIKDVTQASLYGNSSLASISAV